MATTYISKIQGIGTDSSNIYTIKDAEAIGSISKGDNNGQIKITPRTGNAYNVDVKNVVTFTKNTNVTVAGTSKDTYKYEQSAIFAPNGLIMGGTAAAAGLVTRGICGVSTPNADTGAATKDNLYINYDGTSSNNVYQANRQLILQAGSAGEHYGNNVYQYAAVRGDAMKAWVEAKGYITSFTDTLVKQTAKTNDASYKILLGANTNPTSGSAYEAAYDSSITINPSTHTITATTFSGNATSATGFVSAKSIALTGDITGSASGGNGSNGWSIATTIGTGKVTNAMLAGSIANGKLVNSKVTIAGNDVSLGGSLAADTLRSSLGLSNAMHFKGTTTTTMSDGLTTAAVTIGGSSYTPEAGDVVLYSDSEFVWTGSAWERLGRDSSFKVTQTAVTDTAYTGSDTATTFVSAVTQDSNGNITVTKRKLPTYNNYSHPTTTAVDAAAVKVGKDNLGHVVLGSALTNADVGLGNVENTKLSTWAGSSNITTIGTLSSGTVPWARLSGVPSSFTPSSHTHYWASVETTSAAAYNTAPEMATLKLNGNTSASAASTSNVTLVFDATLQALNFVFA